METGVWWWVLGPQSHAVSNTSGTPRRRSPVPQHPGIRVLAAWMDASPEAVVAVSSPSCPLPDIWRLCRSIRTHVDATVNNGNKSVIVVLVGTSGVSIWGPPVNINTANTRNEVHANLTDNVALQLELLVLFAGIGL